MKRKIVRSGFYLILAFCSGIITSAHAGPNASAKMTASVNPFSVSVGGTTELRIGVSGAGLMSAFDLEVLYDESAVAFSTANGLNSFIGFTSTSSYSGSGFSKKLSITGVRLGGDISGSFDLCSIKFVAKSGFKGTTFGILSLYANYYYISGFGYLYSDYLSFTRRPFTLDVILSQSSTPPPLLR